VSDYTGPERRKHPREPRPDVTERILTKLAIISRLHKGGYLEREQLSVPHNGHRA